MAPTNPNPRKYRIAEVCFCGGETGYIGLLPRRRSPLRRLLALRRRGTHTDVEPVMTRGMLDVFVRDNAADDDLPMRWEGDEVVITDMSDESWIEHTLVSVERTEAQRPSQRLAPGRDGLYRVASFDSVGMYVWSWHEVTLAWPSGHVDARTIIDLLSTTTRDGGTTQMRVRMRADIRELAAALNLTSDTTLRKRICYLLYQRDASDSALALPALLPLLSDANSTLRSQAADTILAITNREGHEAALDAAPQAGEVVFTALTSETDDYARAMLAGAVGQLHHEPAIPTLIELLEHEYEQVRRTAAWSLGDMRAANAEPGLRRALEHESDNYAADRMRTALASIVDAQTREPS